MRFLLRHFIVITGVLALVLPASSKADLRNDAQHAAERAVRFLSTEVASHGGYVWRYSSDLTLREGEGVVEKDTIWIQPPGTPSVGTAFVRLYEATGQPLFRDAALAAAEALRQGQMRSGGWQASIEFAAERRKKWAYQVEPPQPKQKDQSSLDDDKTQSALRFLIHLDRALRFQDARVHQTAIAGLTGLLEKGQFENGGFPQVWSDSPAAAGKFPKRQASFPETWSREYQGHQEYWTQPTLNDGLMPDVLETLFLAEEVYGEPRYREAALRAADFLLLAQMPPPQPAWAQQYNAQMHPIWARKLEPAAITGGESQGVIATLLDVYRRTGIPRYLEPIPTALDYLEASTLSDGSLARFYELKTNRPLYFTRDYTLTYDDDDLPTHYGFTVASKVSSLRREYEQLRSLSPEERLASHTRSPRRVSEKKVRDVIAGLDARGGWVSNDGLRYHKQAGPVIDMRATVANLQTLADFLSTDGAAQ